MVRTLLLTGAMLLGSSAASAQITTYVAPPRPLAPTPAMVAAADSAQRDSTAQVAMTNMKAWVDSAAGVSVPAHVGDSVTVVDSTKRVAETFVDGSVAPATASYLPTLALFGAVTFAAGAALLLKRPRG
jgi:hypothetical protein